MNDFFEWWAIQDSLTEGDVQMFAAGGFLLGLTITALFLGGKRRRTESGEVEIIRKGAPGWVQFAVIIGLTLAGFAFGHAFNPR